MFKDIKSFASQAVVYGLGTSGQQIIGIILMPIYMRYLSPADYGILEILSITNVFIGILLAFSIKSGIFRWYYDLNENGRKNLVSTCYNCVFLINSVAVLGMILLREPIAQIFFNDPLLTPLVGLSFLSLLPNQLTQVPLGLLRAQGKAKTYSLYVNGNTLLQALLSITFVVFCGLGLWGIIGANVFAGFIFVVVYFFLIKRYYTWKIDIQLFKQLLVYSFPLAVAMIPITLIDISDRYFLLAYSSLREVGLYSIGYKAGILIRLLIAWPFALAWGPFVISVKDRPEAKQLYARIMDYYLACSLFATLAISILSREVLMAVAPQNYWEAYRVVPLIAISCSIFGIYTIVNIGSYITKKTKRIPVITSMAVCINLLLNYLLVPSYGMMGAAVATVIAYTCMSAGMAYLSQQVYRVCYSGLRILKLWTTFLIILFLGIFIVPDSLFFSLIYKTCLLLLFPILLWGVKFFTEGEVVRLINLKRKLVFRLSRCITKTKNS